MIERKTTNICSDLIGTERGDLLVAECARVVTEQYAAQGKQVLRVELTADHTIGFAVADITIADDDYTPAPMEFGDENELPAGDGATDEGDK